MMQRGSMLQSLQSMANPKDEQTGCPAWHGMGPCQARPDQAWPDRTWHAAPVLCAWPTAHAWPFRPISVLCHRCYYSFGLAATRERPSPEALASRKEAATVAL
jgi:hypothetical protein